MVRKLENKLIRKSFYNKDFYPILGYFNLSVILAASVAESPSKSLFSSENDVLRQTLRQERKRLKLTQAEVAEECRWEQSVIAKIEQGERRVDVVEFIWIAKAMSMKPEKLFSLVLRNLRESAGKDAMKS